MYGYSWKDTATPSGRRIPRLAATALDISVSVCIGSGLGELGEPATVGAGELVTPAGWPTPQSRDWKGSATRQVHLDHNARPLNEVVLSAGWPTPQARDHFPAHSEEYVETKKAQGHGMANLNDTVTLAGWATPGVPNGGRISGNLEDIGKKKDGTKAQISLENLARLTVFGPGPTGFLLDLSEWAAVPASGQLNPAHSRWLMGLPPEWDDSMVTAMESYARKPKRGSSRIWSGKGGAGSGTGVGKSRSQNQNLSRKPRPKKPKPWWDR